MEGCRRQVPTDESPETQPRRLRGLHREYLDQRKCLSSRGGQVKSEQLGPLTIYEGRIEAHQ